MASSIKGGEGHVSDYQILEKIGKGSYGVVYKARNTKTGRIVALKSNEVQNADEWMSQMAEINNVIDLHHETVVNYYNWFFEDEKLYLEMEYCDGGSISDTMLLLKRPLTELEAAAVLKSVVDSIAYVHGLRRIHRDIKAGNLLITSEGVVKLCDFGVSAQLDDYRMKTGTIVGSPYWMAPEIMSQNGYDTKVDIWSIGITAIEIVVGTPPLTQYNPTYVITQIPLLPPPEAPANFSPLFRAFVKKCLIKDPSLRPPITELINDPFLAQISEAKSREIIQDLYAAYRTEKDKKKKEEEDEYVYEEEVYEEEEEDEDGDFLADDDACATVLFSGNDGTFIPQGTIISDDTYNGGTFISSANDGTMIATPATKQESQLAGYKMDFGPTPQQQTSNKSFQAAQKRQFGHFSVDNLKYTIKKVYELAQKNLAEGKVPTMVVKSNYNELRSKIIDELQKKGETVPDDFYVL